ncbi:LamG domain-containing protein [Cellulomonas sp. JH27-2]|uniref:LamG domain-containing protein n=1 Tax=Cellulomonas sp. JH27-2 TaxID=2774139 RepID=UPI00177BA1FC|nr:LamG domain-containing protein [Cellulomonas sp. JH27-2]MBD8059992.1 LamG domain-containing protein [Cellulomonas sp. JH27-2]
MTIPALAPPPAVQAMCRRLTLPFARGADSLDLPLVAGATPDAAVAVPYDFVEHRALYGTTPEASYVLRAVGTGPRGTAVEVSGTDPLAGAFTAVVATEGLGDGDSVAVVLPSGLTPEARLTGVREIDGPTAPAQDRWRATALLGTTARLLWVVGAERDRLTRLTREVHDQRVVARTTGASLDLVGADLAVPRFPPTPYSVDPATVALFHLDDAPGAVPAITDAAAIFPGRTPHHGVLSGTATPGVPARYDRGVRFPGAGSVTIASHADFDVAAGDGLTVELFVRPDAVSTLGFVARRGLPGSPVWALDVGDLGLGGRQSVRATVDDGTVALSVSAAVDLSTDRFTHVALVLSRDGADARLAVVVDGVEQAATSGALGAVGTAGDVVLGPDASGFRGTIDEVRISSVARTHFHPVLGESDESYRSRLALFRRWELPTPGGLQAVLNRLVPVVDGIADPFVVDDTDGPARSGGTVLRVWPAALGLAESIDGDGRPGATEDRMWPPEDGAADPALLGRCTDPRVTFAPVPDDPARDPGLPVPDPHLMRPTAAAAVSRLADLFDASGHPGALTVLAGWDAAAGGSRADARGLLLAAPVVGPGRLAALAHRAGFDLVQHRADGVVVVACAPGRPLLLGPSGAGPVLQVGGTPRLEVGTPVTVEMSLGTPTFAAAAVPPDAEVRFALLGGGDRATLVPTGPGAPTATLTATSPGPLALSGDVVRAGRTTTATVTLQVLPGPMADGASIAADGTTGVGEDVVGPPDPAFDPAYLATLTDPRLVLGPNPEDKQADRGLVGPLVALLDALDADGQPGQVTVAQAYRPAAPAGDLAREGRRLVLTHPVLGADRLAVDAHAAGFAFVARAGTTVVVAGPPGDPVGVTGAVELEVGGSAVLTVDPAPTAVSPTTRLGWSSAQVVPTAPDRQGVQLMSTTAPTVTATARVPGRTWVRATLREAGAPGPYAFEVRLRPELAGARISRDQYYLLMNALHTLHPVGVEVLTEQLRSAVVELGTAPGGLDPSFTYPAFRWHRAVRSLRPQD